MGNTKNNILFYTAMVFAVWFSITGIFWPYLMALFIAYPFGLISLLLWAIIKKDGNPRNKIIIKTLAIGLTISILAFAAMWIYSWLR
jgi:hypothetical protein